MFFVAAAIVYVLKWLNLAQKICCTCAIKAFNPIVWTCRSIGHTYSLQFSILFCTQRLAPISSYNGHACCCWRKDKADSILP